MFTINKQDTQKNTWVSGVKLNAQKIFISHNSCAETFAPLINWVIDDASLKVMPDIDYALLQFTDIMNLQ